MVESKLKIKDLCKKFKAPIIAYEIDPTKRYIFVIGDKDYTPNNSEFNKILDLIKETSICKNSIVFPYDLDFFELNEELKQSIFKSLAISSIK